MATKPNPALWDIPKRYLRVRIYRMDTGKKLYELTEAVRIKFNTVAACSGALTEANIIIGGLQVNSMFDISTAATQWIIPRWYQYEVIIDAGFYTNYTTIFRGTILDASPNLNTADYTLTIKAMSGFNSATTAQSGFYVGKVPVSEIAADLAKKNGLGFVDELKNNSITLTDFSYQNQNLSTVLREIARSAPVDLYVNNNRLYLKAAGLPLTNTPILTIRSENIVGIPQPTSTGCKVKVKMEQGIQTGQNVKLKSAKYPQYDTTNFFLQTLAYSGDTFGSDWYTELELVKTGLGFGL